MDQNAMKLAFAVAFAAIVLCQPVTRAQETLEQQLELIAEFAERLCMEVPLEGKGTGISGSAAAELRGILRRLVGAGVDGAVNFDVTEYAGFAQEQLLDAVQSSVECRLVIWRDLEKRLTTDEQTSGFPCEPPGGLAGTNVERSVVLNNLGSDHARKGQQKEAIACFEQALRFDRSVLVLQNLAWSYWEEGQREKAVDTITQAVALQRQDMQAIDPREIRRLRSNPLGDDCEWRDSFTNEAVSTQTWHSRVWMYVNLGEPERALSDLSEIIDNFPRESCVYEARVGRALADRGKLHCQLDNPEAAASDLSRAAEMGVLDAVAWQEILRRQGYYDGAVDGVVGPGTLGAIQSFALAGCPGMT